MGRNPLVSPHDLQALAFACRTNQLVLPQFGHLAICGFCGQRWRSSRAKTSYVFWYDFMCFLLWFYMILIWFSRILGDFMFSNQYCNGWCLCCATLGKMDVFFTRSQGDVASKWMFPMARLDDPMKDPRVF
jgi:hypothetical protein